MAKELTSVKYAIPCRDWSICSASSLVGTTISVFTELVCSDFSKMWCMVGSKNAAVFPVPVCAHAIKSFLLSMAGIAAS